MTRMDIYGITYNSYDILRQYDTYIIKESVSGKKCKSSSDLKYGKDNGNQGDK